KPVDVVTPVEPKPEPTPVEPEDKPVDNVIPSTPLNPATKLFTDILITSINGDNTVVDDRAEVNEGKLVITAKLDDFKGKEGEYTFTVNSNVNNAGLEQKVTAYVNANGEFTFTMDSNVVNNEQGMIKLSIGSVSDTANVVYVPATPDNTDDKPVDVVTPVEPKPTPVEPEVKPEPTPVVPEDKPVDNVIPSTPLNPATKLFTDILITSINGDNTVVDDRAEVNEGKLVITAKLDDFKGKEGEYTFTVNSNVNNAGLEEKVTAYVNANGEFTFTMDSNVVNNEQGMIKLSIGSVSDTANVVYVPATPDNTD
ncbi:hypothetical protein, partial [Campylobacter sp. MG1]|uniref:hypothetical protein n=1 Tax=Campylobacter sp. MG1 TaxID=2976332 RepID=UPI00226D13C4